MRRAGWPVGVAVAFGLGVVVGAQPWRAPLDRHTVERPMATARHPARQGEVGPGRLSTGEAPQSQPEATTAPRVTTAARRTDQALDTGAVAAPTLARPGQREPGSDGGPPSPPAPAPGQERAAVAASVDGALARFHRYLEEMGGLSARERWQRARQLLDDLRAMGSAGAEALVRALASSASSEERRTAAQLLGELPAPGAVPALLDVLDRDPDVLLRRAAASALRRLQTPEAASAMESLLADPREDRFVRMSAATGLARMGQAQGVAGLVQIFDESSVDGRGREQAFRTLATLSDDRTLVFMRRVVTSDAELAYRLRAIRFLATQGDLQALPALQQVVQAPGEQPSIRDAAAQAVAAIGGR